MSIFYLYQNNFFYSRWLHSKYFLHRDIKPDNFLVGRGEKANRVYMIDYGLAKKFMDPRTKKHIAY